MKATIVRTINFPGAYIEVYSDGDAIVTHSNRYGTFSVVLPAKALAELQGKVVKVTEKKVLPKPVPRIEKVEQGWKVRVQVGAFEKLYYYATRDQARRAKSTGGIGASTGRIK